MAVPLTGRATMSTGSYTKLGAVGEKSHRELNGKHFLQYLNRGCGNHDAIMKTCDVAVESIGKNC